MSPKAGWPRWQWMVGTGPRRGLSLPLAALICCVPGFAARGPGASAASTCGTTLVSSAQANSTVDLLFGWSWGETFRAADTLVSSITVWRSVLSDTNYTALQLFITRVDSAGTPIPWEILLSGPTLEAPITDSVHRLAIKYVLDPPFALPGKGTFFFAIKDADCPFGAMPLMADTLNPYADGQAWKLVPMPDCSGLGQSPRSHHPTLDLQFQIEFCSPTTGVGDGPSGPRHPSISLIGPNPARGRAVLDFTLDRQETFDLTVVDVSGRRVASLGHGVRPAGRYETEWNGRGDDGSRQPAGVYLVRLETPSGIAAVRVPLLR